MRRELRVTFTGYYGMNNFGDDLFGALCVAAARHYWGGLPRLAGPAIAGVESLYTMPRGFPANLYGATNVVGKASRLYSFMRAIQGCDVLVMGGGSVITSRQSFRKPLMLSALRSGRLQLAAVGVSIGPFSSDAEEASVAGFIERFAYIAVRDRRSYELACRMGLGEKTHNGRDLAGLLPLLMPAAAGRASPRADKPIRVGLAPCNYAAAGAYPAPEPQELQNDLVDALARLSRMRPLQVEVFGLNGHALHGDHALASDLRQRLNSRGIATRLILYRAQGPLAVVREIAGCDAFISARLHGAIVAYLQGVPLIIVDYHQKCRDFADDIGLAAAQRVTAQRHGESALSESLMLLLDGNAAPAISPEVYARQSQDVFTSSPWAATETA